MPKIFEVWSSNSEINPFRAWVVCSNSEMEGKVFVQPPFWPSDDTIEMMSDDVNIGLRWVGTTTEGALFEYNIDNSFVNMTPRDKVAYTIGQLLDVAGAAYSYSVFRRQAEEEYLNIEGSN